MDFLRRLFGRRNDVVAIRTESSPAGVRFSTAVHPERGRRRDGAVEVEIERSGAWAVPPAVGSGTDWLLPPLTEPHPNAPRATSPEQGSPERWNWVTPSDSVVLNAKGFTGVSTIRIEAPGGATRQEFLRTFTKSPNGIELRQAELRLDGEIGVYHRGRRLGMIPDDARPRLRAYLETARQRGLKTLTRAHVVPGNLSSAMGRHPASATLIAEVSIPPDDQPLFADAYDASFSFPWERVRAWRDTPEGRLAYEQWLANMPPPREYFPIGIGEHIIRATRNESDWQDAHVRGLELMDPDTSVWMRDELPAEVARAGIRVVRVAGISNYPARLAPAFAPEQHVALVAEPNNPYDRNAIAVFSLDRRQQVGHLPRADAQWLTTWTARTGQRFDAIVLTEFVERATGERTALRLLIAPQPIVLP